MLLFNRVTIYKSVKAIDFRKQVRLDSYSVQVVRLRIYSILKREYLVMKKDLKQNSSIKSWFYYEFQGTCCFFGFFPYYKVQQYYCPNSNIKFSLFALLKLPTIPFDSKQPKLSSYLKHSRINMKLLPILLCFFSGFYTFTTGSTKAKLSSSISYDSYRCISFRFIRVGCLS